MRRARLLAVLIAAAALAGCASEDESEPTTQPAPLNQERPERQLPSDEAGRGERE